ncbi:MAG: ISL3 family transposase [Verrucomicrobiota bacterium]|nr:ISL3 family transposase [Verrucomicrobiota bacterium]
MSIRLGGFVYEDERLVARGTRWRLGVTIRPHTQRAPPRGVCRRPGTCHGHTEEREWTFVPLFGLEVVLKHTPQRVDCATDGARVEFMPWNEGKRTTARVMMQFLGNWARRLSWKETGEIFKVSWQTVHHSVQWMAEWGKAHRSLDGIRAIGIDELHFGKGKRSANFLTLIYQVDVHCRRLLWVGKRRAKATLRRSLNALGGPILDGIRYVCSDMWKAYVTVVAKRLPEAVHLLDRFHVVQHLNQAVDEFRRRESAAAGKTAAGQRLKKMRRPLLKQGARVLGKAREKLQALIRSRSKTARGYVLKEAFLHFWTYRHPTWARAFLVQRIRRVKRSRLLPMIKVAKMIEKHQPLILNWLRARGEVRTGAVEGFNNKARVITKRAYGFRIYETLELALYHNLAQLPQPEVTHRFW